MYLQGRTGNTFKERERKERLRNNDNPYKESTMKLKETTTQSKQ